MNFLLTKEQWISIGKGLLIAVGGAVATYLTTLASSGEIEFGPMTPIVVAGFSVAINYIRKALETLKES
jgi:hypothetical protein